MKNKELCNITGCYSGYYPPQDNMKYLTIMNISPAYYNFHKDILEATKASLILNNKFNGNFASVYEKLDMNNYYNIFSETSDMLIDDFNFWHHILDTKIDTYKKDIVIAYKGTSDVEQKRIEKYCLQKLKKIL